jgi:hypothetical protein
MKKIISSDKGNILVLAAVGMLAVLGFASLSVDVGCLMTARAQLQNAVDAAALAGASGLLYNPATATNRAIYFGGCNTCLNRAVQLSGADITFPTANRIHVLSTFTAPLFFARAFGINQVNIAKSATAEIASICATNGLRPLAIPQADWSIGDAVVIKQGSSNDENPSFFYPIDFPPLNRGNPISGASVYRDNLANGSSSMVHINDVLQVEPGNMVGPTQAAVNDLIALDAQAYWDGQRVVNSSYAGSASPRIIKIPLYDPAYPPANGRNQVTIAGLGAFFVEGFAGKNLIGRFIRLITNGEAGGGYSMLYRVKLSG